jgi:hypothetical protein
VRKDKELSRGPRIGISEIGTVPWMFDSSVGLGRVILDLGKAQSPSFQEIAPPTRREVLAGLAALGSAAPCRLWSAGAVGSATCRRRKLILEKCEVSADPPCSPTLTSLEGKIRITDIKIIPVSAGAHTPYVFVQVITQRRDHGSRRSNAGI